MYYFLFRILVLTLFSFLHVHYNIQSSTTFPFVYLAFCNKVTLIYNTLFVPEPDGRRDGTQSGSFLHLIYQEIKESKFNSLFLAIEKVSHHEYGHLTSSNPSLQYLQLAN